MSAVGKQSFERVSSGIAGLDTILGGGFMRGRIYILRGDPGAGKTILSNQICFHHITGGKECALFITLLAENHARMVGNLGSLSFFDESKIPDRFEYLSALRELREGGPKGVSDLIRREIQRRRCTMLVLDGLISARVSSESDQAFKQFIYDLQEVAIATDCTMFLTTNAGAQEVSPEETMVDGVIELTDRVYAWRAESDLQVRKFRGSGFLRGRHAYKITDTGIVVYPRIEALLAHPTRPDEGGIGKISSGVDRLDIALGGGLPVASTTMVMGPSGIGKTTIGLHFLSKSSEQEPGLLFSFYETVARINSKVDQICRPLRPLLDSGAVEVLWQPTDDMLDAYGARLLEAVHRRGVKRLFIDGLTNLKKTSVESSRMDSFFAALANELRVLGVTTVYTLELPVTLEPAIRIPIDDISTIAENMILLRYIELRSQLYRLISILKMRDSGFDPSLHEFVIGANGIAINKTFESAESILSGLAQRRESEPSVKNRAARAKGSEE